jgi:type I restriction enzyme S subunit
MSEKIPNGWKRVKLGEVVDVRDGTHDSPKPSKIGKFLITSKHIKNGKIDFSKAYKISFDDFEKINKRSKVDKWDILFSMIGTIGETVIVKDEPDFAIKNIGLFKTKGNIDLGKWIFYYLKSPYARDEMQAMLKGTTQEYITLGDLRNFPILLPPLPEQKAIAGILSSLDDKIDLLHRQNKTLEEMAQTLFRKWFIEDAQEDWEEVSLEDIVEIKYGKNLPTSKLGTEGYPVFGGSGIIGYYINYLYEEPQVLVSCRGSSSGKVIISEPYSFITNNSFILERSKNDWFSFEFLKYWALNYDFSPYISGSAQPQITINDLFDASIILPKDKTIIRRFSILTKPIEEKILKNKLQIRTLEQLRDTLLPKLMSGEVRVKL